MSRRKGNFFKKSEFLFLRMYEHPFKQFIYVALFLSLSVWLSDSHAEAAQYIAIFTFGAFSGLFVAKDYNGTGVDPKPILLALSAFFFVLTWVLK